jgi:hypothetical protein
MELELTIDEAGHLREILSAYLVGLRREVSRTEQRAMRHELVMRLDVCETMIERLEMTAEPAM